MPEHTVVLSRPLKQAREEQGAFSVRYGSRPESLRKSELSLRKEGSEYVVKSTTTDNTQVFRGSASSAKEVECVLIYNPKTKSYELHPINFSLKVNAPREQQQRSAIRAGSVSASRRTTMTPTVESPAIVIEEASEDDDFGDLASELADELGDAKTPSLDAATARVIGTAGSINSRNVSQRPQEDDSSSEEE